MSRKFVGGEKAGKDLYKLLKIEQGSTLKEIKIAYKKLALVLHPDRTQGDTKKTQLFKDISEAYNILSSDRSRRQYDLQNGHRYNKNRRTAPPKNYRKVYAPAPNPNAKKTTFDHTKHYEMHYGKGMMDEAFADARREAARQGRVDPGAYQSPLGQGFQFDKSGGINDTTNPYAKKGGAGVHSINKQQQQTVWEYEEGTMGFDGEDKASTGGRINKRATVVESVDIDGTRSIRKAKEEERRRKAEQDANSPFQPKEEGCIIQ